MHVGELGFVSRGLSRESGDPKSFKDGYKDEAVCKIKNACRKMRIDIRAGD